MSVPVLHVQQAGWQVTLQDGGRQGYRHLGVPSSGALDGFALSAVNALLGNEPLTATLEISGPAGSFQAQGGAVRLAWVGELAGKIIAADGATRTAKAWRTHTLQVGEVLQLGAVQHGLAYLAVQGGWALTPQLGSVATYPRAALGGLRGQVLQAGDVLPCAVTWSGGAERQASPWPHATTAPIRLLRGAHAAQLTPASQQALLSQDFTVSPARDRMGMRLQGAALHFSTPPSVLSTAVLPGTLQLPPDGQIIALLADAQTTGGYPMLGQVIRADLGRLAQAPTGTALRFAWVEPAAAQQAWQQRWAGLADWARHFKPVPHDADESDELNEQGLLHALLHENLISGVVCE